MYRARLSSAVLIVTAIVKTVAFQGNISIFGDRLVGGTAAVQCAWITSPGEAVYELDIKSPPSRNYYYKMYPNSKKGRFRKGTQYHRRITLDPTQGVEHVATMRISNLQCADSMDYSCVFVAGSSGHTGSVSVNTAHLDIKIPPKAPRIRTEPDLSFSVEELTLVNTTCEANLGRIGSGTLLWKISRNRKTESIHENDPRIIVKRNVPLEPEDLSCSQRVQETFSMKVTKTDQGLVISCFVVSSDFPRPLTLETCQQPADDLCASTEAMNIFSFNDASVNTEDKTNSDNGNSKSVHGNKDNYNEAIPQNKNIFTNRIHHATNTSNHRSNNMERSQTFNVPGNGKESGKLKKSQYVKCVTRMHTIEEVVELLHLNVVSEQAHHKQNRTWNQHQAQTRNCTRVDYVESVLQKKPAARRDLGRFVKSGLWGEPTARRELGRFVKSGLWAERTVARR